MNVHELPMILFTVIAQMSVGTFIVLGVIQLIASLRHDRRTVDRLTDPILYAIGPAMVLGLAVSMLHMNDITHTFNVFRHIGSSWLSREIVFGIGFAALGFAFAVMQWFKFGSSQLRQALAALTAVVGIALVWAMSQIYYSLLAVPAWNTAIVPFQFFATTLLLGALATGTALTISAVIRRRTEMLGSGNESEHVGDVLRGDEPAPRGSSVAVAVRERVAEVNAPTTDLEWSLTTAVIQNLAFFTATVGVAILISYPVHVATLSAGNDAAQASAQVFSGAFFLMRLVLLGLAAIALALAAHRTAGNAVREHPGVLAAIMSTAFVLAFAAELMGRSLHYDSLFLVGI